MTKSTRLLPLGALLACLLGACGGDRPEMIAESTGSGAVRVRFDLAARPFPEVPLPTDSATRLDDGSPTGRLVNISKMGPTLHESDVRSLADRLSGFGIYQPITVPLTGKIDLENVVTRQWRNKDLGDDVALLIDIDPQSPGFGEAVPLDFGQGNFPIVVERLDLYFENDVRARGSNLLFETEDEDFNRNGRLDPGEDTNADHILGKPNVFPGWAEARAGDPSFFPDVDDLCPFFEFATDTLIFRPIMPLRQRTRYAVVLTKNLLGADGEPVGSPFDGVHPAGQAAALRPLGEVLAKNGFSLDDVAFTWVYTTQDVTGDLEAIRAGLYGHGPFARLGGEFPPSGLKLVPLRTDGGPRSYLMPMSVFLPLAQALGTEVIGGGPEARALAFEDLAQIDYIVGGALPGPNFMVDRDGIAEPGYPADDDESFEVDRMSGEAVYGRTDITFWCFVPKESPEFKQPFDVLVMSHGYGSSRFDAFSFAGRLARYGIATCGFDAFTHGLVIPDMPVDLKPLIKADHLLAAIREYFSGSGYGGMADLLSLGRARDLNNDGIPDTGGDFWTFDTFHTRDNVRQTLVDWMQLIRWMRTFDGASTWAFDTDGDGRGDLAGDFNGDGVPDFGTRARRHFAMGGSLGGILTGVLLGIEPALDAAVPVVGGAGLIDIAIRSRQGGVPEAVLMPLLGPFVSARPAGLDQGGGVQLGFLLNDVNSKAWVPFHVSKVLRPGDRVLLENLNNGKTDEAIAGPDGGFRLAVAADALSATEKRPVLGMLPDNSNVPVTVTRPEALGDPLRIRVFDGLLGPEKEVIETWQTGGVWQGARYLPGARLCALNKGFAHKRQTPDFRRFLNLAAMVLEPGDPVGYQRYAALEQLDYSYDPDVVSGDMQPGTATYFMPTIGDMNVPVNTGIAMARAAGVIELSKVDPRWGKSENDVLIDTHVIEGTERTRRHLIDDGQGGERSVLFDIDDLNQGSAAFGEPNLDPPLRLTKKVGPRKIPLALRIPYGQDTGSHGFGRPDPAKTFDMGSFVMNQVGWFLYTADHEMRDDACLEDGSCGFLPERVRVGLPVK